MQLTWKDGSIPHQLALNEIDGHTQIQMTIVKDVEPEQLTLTLSAPLGLLSQAWQEVAMPVSEAYDDGNLYTQTRCLFNLTEGCVLWLVNHVKMPNGKKMSADRLVWIPAMNAIAGKLTAIK